jgi:hypothetical protein
MLGVLISRFHVLQMIQKRICLLDLREWQILEQMANQVIGARTDERYFLGCLAILVGPEKNNAYKHVENEEYAEY